MPIELPNEIRHQLAHGLDEDLSVVWASVDADGQPEHSFYGSSHVHEADQLAIWVRNPAASGFLHRIAGNPRVAGAFLNLAERIAWRFEGRARVVEDEATRARVYDESHEIERNKDPDRTGVAVLVDLDRVRGRGFEQVR